LAKAATSMGLLKSFRKSAIKDMSMSSPFCCGIFDQCQSSQLSEGKYC
jgi:hypothetical protein